MREQAPGKLPEGVVPIGARGKRIAILGQEVGERGARAIARAREDGADGGRISLAGEIERALALLGRKGVGTPEKDHDPRRSDPVRDGVRTVFTGENVPAAAKVALESRCTHVLAESLQELFVAGISVDV